MKQYISRSAVETKEIAASLSQEVTQGRIISLSGNLGAGKTVFVQGFAQGLGIKEKIISPTFVLIRQHKTPKAGIILYHIDLYRIENSEDFKLIGLEEILSNPNNIILIEWAEKIDNLLPKNTLKIKIEKREDNNARLISIF